MVAVTYRERLHAPVSYWAIGVLVGVSTAVAIGFYLGPWVAVAAGVVTVAAVTAVVGWWGSTEIVVDADGVRVGPSLLEWPYVGAVEVLDRTRTRERLGVNADAAAHVVQRPYLSESVLIQVRDAADPHPYWLVSSRSPAGCAAAIADARPDPGQGLVAP